MCLSGSFPHLPDTKACLFKAGDHNHDAMHMQGDMESWSSEADEESGPCIHFPLNCRYQPLHAETYAVRSGFARVQPAVQRLRLWCCSSGTYTPIAHLGLGGSLGRTLLLRVWVGAAAGILKCFLWVRAPRVLSTGIYIGLGWIILPHAKEVRGSLTSAD